MILKLILKIFFFDQNQSNIKDDKNFIKNIVNLYFKQKLIVFLNPLNNNGDKGMAHKKSVNTTQKSVNTTQKSVNTTQKKIELFLQFQRKIEGMAHKKH